MLENIRINNIGPAPEMELAFGSRLNLITGDNGLGKSFLLDVAWWVLTRHWPQELNPRLTSGYAARPVNPQKPATIEFRLKSKSKTVSYESNYSAREQAWIGRSGRPWNPGLVIYAHADGGFSVWDPARNYWKKKGSVDIQDRLPGYVFSPKEVWDGLKVDVGPREEIVCNGLIRDWASWIMKSGPEAERMSYILSKLSPSREEQIIAGPPTRMSLNDVRDIPSIRTGYADAVPILLASSGIRRIVALAYVLLWSWQEHRIAAELIQEDPTQRVILLVDELESHLHPKWQRTILSSLLDVAKVMHKEATIQIIAATHSPLILASAEPFFDKKKDAWFDLDLNAKAKPPRVELRKRDFVRRGSVGKWLTSEAFDLKEDRSLQAELAIGEALELVKVPRPSPADIQRVDRLLRDSLSEIDPLWMRWEEFRMQHGVRR